MGWRRMDEDIGDGTRTSKKVDRRWGDVLERQEWMGYALLVNSMR